MSARVSSSMTEASLPRVGAWKRRVIGKVDGELDVDEADELEQEEGVTAKVEEVVRGGDGVDVEQLCPELGETEFGGSEGGAVSAAEGDGSSGGLEQAAAVNLAIGGERH